jgi:hypothetical protein
MIYIIPDTQSRPNVRNPLIVYAYHICELKPKHVIHLGDHWDFPSLSQYDKGKKSHRVKSYLADVRAGNFSMAEFWAIIEQLWPKYKEECEFTILYGNHEDRRRRALEYGPDELVSLLEEFPMDYDNWSTVVPFLKTYKIKGINFCHYFQNEGSARPIGTARQLIMKKHVSCIAGHKQGFDYEEMITGDEEKVIQCMIIGSGYYHDEAYKTHTNHHWRGSVILYNVHDGMYDYARYSLTWLDGQYIKKAA